MKSLIKASPVSGLFKKSPENEASAILFKLTEELVHAISQVEQAYYSAKPMNFLQR